MGQAARRSLLASPWTLLIIVVVGVLATSFPTVMQPVGFAAVAGYAVLRLFRALEGFWCPSCGERSLRPDPERPRDDGASYWCPSCQLSWHRSWLWGWREQPRTGKGQAEPPAPRLDPWSDGSLAEIHESGTGTHGSLLRRKLSRRHELDLKNQDRSPSQDA